MKSSTGAVSYFIITLLIILECFAEMDEFPRIEIISVPSKSEEGLLATTNRKSVSIFENVEAEFQCVSNSPIYWNIKIRYLNNDQITIENKIIALQRFDDRSSYQYITKVKIHGMSTNLIGNYICETISNSSLSKSLIVFLEDENDPFYINAGSSLQVQTMGSEHQLLIPCPVSRPSEKFHLLLQKGWKSTRVVADFIPHRGFILRSENSFEGNYKCTVDGHEDDSQKSIDVNVVSSNYIVSPATSLIYAKDELLVKCSASYPVFMELEQNKNLKHHEILYETLPWNPFHYSVSLKHKMDIMDSDDEEGVVRCTRSNKSPIHQWKYKLIDDEHGLTFVRENAKVACKSTIMDKTPTFTFRYCHVRELCKIPQRTSEDANHIESGDTRDFEVSECGEGCFEASLKSGDIQKYGSYTANCTIDGYTEISTFVLGLDKKLHNDKEVVPDDALIFMRRDEVPTKTGHIIATCECLSFHFAHSVFWKLILNNGSAIFINEGFSKVSEKNGVITSKLDYQSDSTKIKELQCIVGFRNSSNWKIKSLRLNNFSMPVQDPTIEAPAKTDKKDTTTTENNHSILEREFWSEKYNFVTNYFALGFVEGGPEIRIVYWFVMAIVANMIAIYLVDSIRSIQINDTRPISNGASKTSENRKQDCNKSVYSDDEEEQRNDMDEADGDQNEK